MSNGFVIRKNQYFDSLFLMGINKRLLDQPGVQQTAVLMGSENNKKLFSDIGITDTQINAALANDLIVGVVADTQQTVQKVLGMLDQFLTVTDEKGSVESIRTLQEALEQKPSANLSVISVPGEYAAREAQKSLDAGLNVFLFSDNVSIEDELNLKQHASTLGLLVMGPDCGTSIIGGKGIGFANSIRRGNIGVIGAAGTGLQEFTSLVHNAGGGISHAIGTGSHDLSDTIGGITTFTALDALEHDPQTSIIAIVSKPPGLHTLGKLDKRLMESTKPIVACIIGVQAQALGGHPGYQVCSTIDDAVYAALGLAGVKTEKSPDPNEFDPTLLAKEKSRRSPEQVFLRGLFAGGTFCYQTQQILASAGLTIYSNTPIDKKLILPNPESSRENSVVDMGDDFFMQGKPHPMIDGTMRKLRVVKEGRDPKVAILLLDFILGFNASMDPIGEVLDALIEAKRQAEARGGYLSVVASICGTSEDQQDLNLQTRLLQEAGIVVFNSNARAAHFCAELVKP